MKFKVKAIRTKYWKPGCNYLHIILDSIQGKLKNGDVIVISEKAISVAKGNIIDENNVKPGLLAKFIARFWMRYVWGYFLGRICHLKPESIRHLRDYPLKNGPVHKQVVLKFANLLQALKCGSEGGIDTSNLPYAYACLPLKNPEREAEKIFSEIKGKTGKVVTVVIADTDSTFSFCCTHFTTRPNSIAGIRSFGGVISFILGRALKLKQRATPLAVAGSKISVEEALNLAEIAHHTRGYGAGRTVWNAAQRFGVGFTEVDWEMLDRVKHYPIVLIRRMRCN